MQRETGWQLQHRAEARPSRDPELYSSSSSQP